MVTRPQSWHEAIVEGSLEWSFLSAEDLSEIAELRAAIEYFDDPALTRSLSDLLTDFHLPYAHPTHHAVIGRDKGGTIVAYAWNHINDPHLFDPKIWIEIGVHPAWRHHKIGLKLIDWCLDRARLWLAHLPEENIEVSSLLVECTTEERSHIADDLIKDGRLQPRRWFFDASIELADLADKTVIIPDGFELKRFTMDVSEQLRCAHNEAFSTRPGAHDVDRASWQASLQRPAFRPQWSWYAVALESGDIAGYALNSEIAERDDEGSQGWTERFGIRPPYRSCGLGRALLSASVMSFIDAGCRSAGVGIDTDDAIRASAVFEKMGYRIDDKIVNFAARFSL